MTTIDPKACERLTDSELAVTIDSLAFMREKILADAPEGTPTTNIDAALAKLAPPAPDVRGLTFWFNR